MTKPDLAEAVRLAEAVVARYHVHTVIAGSLQDDANRLAQALLASEREREAMRKLCGTLAAHATPTKPAADDEVK